jgi:hypothetical protein
LVSKNAVEFVLVRFDLRLIGQDSLLVGKNAVEFGLVRFDFPLVAQDFVLVAKDPLLVSKQFVVWHRFASFHGGAVIHGPDEYS